MPPSSFRVATSEGTNIDPEMRKILDTIKSKESGGNYNTPRPIGMPGTASGAYAITNPTWKTWTEQSGIGKEYPSAYLAPPEIQDQVAAFAVRGILKKSGGDVSKVPLAWYTGNIQGNLSADAVAKNNGLTPEQYQSRWMDVYTGRQNISEIGRAHV